MIKKLNFILSRLWQYHNLYFLKPFDAVNDTLTARLIHQLDWEGSVVEIGSGDGVYSYIMHGGTFPLWFDRYWLTDLSKSDMYASHIDNFIKPSKKLTTPNIELAIDERDFHVAKIKEIGFAKNAVQSAYEQLPLETESVHKIFYYTAHGLEDYGKAIEEANRILKKGGKMLVLLFDKEVTKHFVCHQLSQSLKNKNHANYFAKLDNGRYEELNKISNTIEDWTQFFELRGFKLTKTIKGLSPIAWKIYDTQTRPFLKILIRLFNKLPKQMRTFCKIGWMLVCYPFLVLFYILFANDVIKITNKNCYLGFEFTKQN